MSTRHLLPVLLLAFAGCAHIHKPKPAVVAPPPVAAKPAPASPSDVYWNTVAFLDREYSGLLRQKEEWLSQKDQVQSDIEVQSWEQTGDRIFASIRENRALYQSILQALRNGTPPAPARPAGAKTTP